MDRQKCDFLLMNNTYLSLRPISHRIQVIADYWSCFRYRQGGHLFEVIESLNSGPRHLTARYFKHPLNYCMVRKVFFQYLKTFRRGS